MTNYDYGQFRDNLLERLKNLEAVCRELLPYKVNEIESHKRLRFYDFAALVVFSMDSKNQRIVAKRVLDSSDLNKNHFLMLLTVAMIGIDIFKQEEENLKDEVIADNNRLWRENEELRQRIGCLQTEAFNRGDGDVMPLNVLMR